jgi:hypothetical protein
MSAPPKKSEWFTFQTLTFLVGLLMTAFASYNTFQKDTSKEIRDLQIAVAVLASKVERLEGMR